MDTQKIFIGKTGFIGPRGGLHDTFMHEGTVKVGFFRCLSIKCQAQFIKKVIIRLD
jgi:hypothetical protein